MDVLASEGTTHHVLDFLGTEFLVVIIELVDVARSVATTLSADFLVLSLGVVVLVGWATFLLVLFILVLVGALPDLIFVI